MRLCCKRGAFSTEIHTMLSGYIMHTAHRLVSALSSVCALKSGDLLVRRDGVVWECGGFECKATKHLQPQVQGARLYDRPEGMKRAVRHTACRRTGWCLDVLAVGVYMHHAYLDSCE